MTIMGSFTLRIKFKNKIWHNNGTSMTQARIRRINYNTFVLTLQLQDGML